MAFGSRQYSEDVYYIQETGLVGPNDEVILTSTFKDFTGTIIAVTIESDGVWSTSNGARLHLDAYYDADNYMRFEDVATGLNPLASAPHVACCLIDLAEYPGVKWRLGIEDADDESAHTFSVTILAYARHF